MEEKYILFTTKTGNYKTTDNVYDSLTWTDADAALYPASSFVEMRPATANTIDMFFYIGGQTTRVTLDIKNGTHVKVMSAVSNAISKSNQAIITIADVRGHVFVHPDIYGATVRSRENYIQSLTNNSRTAITCPRDNYNSLIIANIDGSAAVACTLELHDGTTYSKILDQISIPAKQSLVLEKNEISFDRTTYTLHATSGDSDGQLTFTFNY